MTNKEKELWLKVKYPITIIRDRYEGTYSGALWLVFPVDYNEIPEGVDGDDVECAEFWESYKEPVGKGTYPNDALADLLEKMNESEDERIREWLIRTVHLIGVDKDICADQETMDKAIAWLEKQKEQKPVEDKAFAEWIEDYWSHNKVNNPYSYNKGEEIQFDHRGFISFCEAYCYSRKPVLHDTFGYEEGRQVGRNEGVKLVLNEPDKYGLCKPAEWSEEDEKVIEAACALLCEYAGYYKEKDMEAKNLQLFKVSQRLKSLRPQPKEGWSEEDESRLDHAITTLAENVKRGSAREDFEFLASLPRRFNLQPKTEWSDEDRRTIVRACVALRAYANGELPDILPSEILGYADKLQSLRPSWKPSEEQMKALLNAEGLLRKDKFIAIASKLAELYEQLKKL